MPIAAGSPRRRRSEDLPANAESLGFKGIAALQESRLCDCHCWLEAADQARNPFLLLFSGPRLLLGACRDNFRPGEGVTDLFGRFLLQTC